MPRTIDTTDALDASVLERRVAFYRSQLYRAPRHQLLRAAVAGVVFALAVFGLAAAAHAAPAPVRASSVRVVGAGGGRTGPETPVRTLAQVEALASAVAGRPVTVSCDADGFPTPQTEGYVTFTNGATDSVIHLRRGLCGPLESLGARTVGYWREQYPTVMDTNAAGQVIDEQDGIALSVLNHEATHIATQSEDEGAVECRSFSTVGALVSAYQLPAYLATRVLRGVAWFHGTQLPAAYRTAC